MESQTFIVEMTKALAWPAGAVTLALLFKTQLRRLLERLEHLEAPGVKAEFSDKLEKVEANFPLENQGTSSATLPASSHVDTELPADYLIIQAWKQLEGRLQTLALNRQLGDRRGTFRDIRLIAEKLPLPDEIVASVKDLRSLRNQAVHPTPEGKKPTTTDALRYVDVVAEVLRALPAL